MSVRKIAIFAALSSVAVPAFAEWQYGDNTNTRYGAVPGFSEGSKVRPEFMKFWSNTVSAKDKKYRLSYLCSKGYRGAIFKKAFELRHNFRFNEAGRYSRFAKTDNTKVPLKWVTDTGESGLLTGSRSDKIFYIFSDGDNSGQPFKKFVSGMKAGNRMTLTAEGIKVAASFGLVGSSEAFGKVDSNCESHFKNLN